MKILSKVYVALVFIFLYAPIAVMMMISFNDSTSTYVFTGFSLQWYQSLLHDKASLLALRNTLVLAVLSSVISTVIGTLAAVGMRAYRNKYFQSGVMLVTNLPMMNPDIVTGVSMMLMFAFVGGLTGAKSSLNFLTLLIAHITFCIPYVFLSVQPKVRQMDKHLSEAAMDLGCTPLQTFLKVELPAIMPGILSGLITAFTLSLDDFVISYFTIGSGFETLPIHIYTMTKKSVRPDMYALSTLIFAVVFVLLLLSNMVNRDEDEKIQRAKRKQQRKAHRSAKKQIKNEI